MGTETNERIMHLRAPIGYALIDPEWPTHAGKIILPESVTKKDIPKSGRVLSVSGCRLTKTGIRVGQSFAEGDRVAYRPFTGLLVEHERRFYMKVPIHDVLAVLENGVRVE